MRSLAFRRAARVFAVLLLVWTGADLFDYGLCVHDHHRIGAFGQAAWRCSSTEGDCTPDGVDDCFCCSHVIEAGSPFHISLHYHLVWLVPDEAPGQPHLTAAPPYHPPIG